MMQLKFKILIKILLLLLVIVLCNFVYTKYFFEKDIQKYSEIINLVRSADKQRAEIVYLGESSDFSSRETDMDKRSICQFISDYFPDKKFGDLSSAATHAGIFYTLLKNIPEKCSVKTIIVTLNLRSFDASWINSDLETPLQKSMVLLKDYPPLLNRFLLSFHGYDQKSVLERKLLYKKSMILDKLFFSFPFPYHSVFDWDNAMAAKGIKNNEGSINYPLTELACHYIKTYAFQIDTLKNPRIKDFDNIVSLSRKHNWNVVFNLMAENVETANSLVGKELVGLIKQNRDLLVKRYSKQNVLVIDNLEKVHNLEFTDQNWTTEHYSEVGRKIVAANVAMGLKTIYPNDYKSVIYKPVVKVKKLRLSEFFNDCEGTEQWGQMQTLNDENAFSGKKSSKVGMNNEFSITFESNVSDLPDSLKQVVVDFQIFQKNISSETKLVIEISGQHVQMQWNGFSLNNLTKENNKWESVHFTFPLPSNFYLGDLIKVYILNPGNKILYVDDIKVKFQ